MRASFRLNKSRAASGGAAEKRYRYALREQVLAAITVNVVL